MATADEYAAWIVANKAQKGTPRFDTVARAYQDAKAEDAQAALADSEAPAAPAAPVESAAFTKGRNLPSGVQGFLTAVQGPAFGFADEFRGAATAAGHAIGNLTPWGNSKSIPENYRAGRDVVRGANTQFEADHPVLAPVTQVMTAAPLAAAGGITPAAAPVAGQILPKIGFIRKAIQAAKVAAPIAAIAGFGNSKAEEPFDMASDAARAAMWAGLFASGLSVTGSTIGGAASKIGETQVYQNAVKGGSASLSAAMEHIGKLFARSGMTADQVKAKLQALGPEATLADALGPEGVRSLDLVATLPGKTKTLVETLIHDRQAGRAARMLAGANAALGTGGADYAKTLESVAATQKARAAPLYKALEGVVVSADDELVNLLKAAGKAHGRAEAIAQVSQQPALNLGKIKAGDNVPLAALDTVKQSLWDVGQAAKVEFKPTKLSSAYDKLRRSLTDKIDALSPVDAAGPLTAQARNAWAGPAAVKEAIEAGRTVMRTDVLNVQDLVKNLQTASERDAFRIGALQALREKIGTEGGQTSLLKMWKEPSTSDRIKAVFGNSYKAFADFVEAEGKLKALEGVGRGSQTASRIFGAGDMDAEMAMDVGKAAISASHGNVLPAMGTAAKLWNSVQTPENTRNEIGRLLLRRGGVEDIQQFSQAVAAAQARRAALLGVGGAATAAGVIKP